MSSGREVRATNQAGATTLGVSLAAGLVRESGRRGNVLAA